MKPFIDTELFKRLGRIESVDARDSSYLISNVLSLKENSENKSSYKYWWSSGWWGDQGRTPQCVAYAWLHWVEDGPVTHFYEGRNHDPSYMNKHDDSAHKSLLIPSSVYDECQKIDRWPGEDYDGTSVRAGAKVLKRKGLIKEYRWAWDLDTAIAAILEKGPVVVGTKWYVDMFYPDKNGIIKVGGDFAGGHAYVVNGVNLNKRLVRIKNSWGRNWGRNGYAYMTFNDFSHLINDGGEICLAIEKKKK